MDAVDFLRALYESAPPDAGVVELRALKNSGGFDARLFTSEPDDIRAFAGRYRSTNPAGAYFGVALRKPGSTTGKKTDISAITAFWADVDVVKLGWDMDRTLGLIKGHELRPSVIVNSGNGLHLYWVLDEAVTHLMNVQLFEVGMARLAEVFSGDRTHDVTRVLRLPGTWNTKDPEKPKPVKVVMADWREYRVEDIFNGAQETNQLLATDGWIDREQMKLRQAAARAQAVAEGRAVEFTSATGLIGKRLSWAQIWSLARYKGAAPGTAWLGLDEAILRATARLYADAPMMTDEQIVDRVLGKVREVKEQQAPNEVWDWSQERREIADKLARFKPRWAQIVDERGRAKKGNR